MAGASLTIHGSAFFHLQRSKYLSDTDSLINIRVKQLY